MLEIQTRISRKFGLIFRQTVLGAIYARFGKLSPEVARQNNEIISEANSRLYQFLASQGIADPVRIFATIELEDNGLIKKIKITKIEVYKKEKELLPNIEVGQ
ncbi:MAG: hypothetical protein GXO42_02080 [bacterium]|nr:hypothetical protein [bacterium]